MHTTTSADFAHAPATIRIGDLEVCRLGFGAMRLPGPDVWGEPADPERARAVLRRVVELGINLIDTSWYYGPLVANRLIAETLWPYPRDLLIACKLGGRRTPDKGWAPYLRPEELRLGCEEDLRSLKLDRLDVVHLRFMNAGVPFLEALDALIELQREGKIRHLALSNVSAAQVEAALTRAPIVAVQNIYSVAGGGSGPLAKMAHAEVESPEAVLDLCAARGIAFLPFFPLAVGNVGKAKPALAAIAERHGASPAQIALAWLLARSKVMVPIPGTGSVAHLEENWAARTLLLTAEELGALAAG
jgi:pyridoxine 4-dehydrogenase